MALETASTIDQLVTTNPPDTDPLAETDDHIRLIKSTLKTTFPSLVGATTVTSALLNGIPAVNTRVATLESNRARLDIPNAFAASQYVDGNVDMSGKVYEAGHVLLPPGIIAMWAGTVALVPAGWRLCDGTAGTPDLRDRFIVGAGGSYAPGLTGGSATASGTTSASGAYSPGSTGAAGVHAHGNTTSAHVLTLSEIPGHSHTATVTDPGHYHPYGAGFGPVGVGGIGGGSGFGVNSANTDGRFTDISVALSTDGGGLGHAHTIGADGDHVHSIPSAPNHTHTVTVVTMPPFMALCFIMKT